MASATIGAERITVATKAVTPTVDRDSADATNVTINFIAATATVEGIAGREAMATSVEPRR